MVTTFQKMMCDLLQNITIEKIKDGLTLKTLLYYRRFFFIKILIHFFDKNYLEQIQQNLYLSYLNPLGLRVVFG